MKFWPPASWPAVNQQENVGDAGNERHPTIAPGGRRPKGHRITTRRIATVVQLEQPDPMAVQLAGSMAIATNTRSPMADHGHVFRGDPGYAVNRFGGKLQGPQQTFGANIRPITYPGSIRVGMQAGPSSQPGFPSTGANGDAGLQALAMLNGSVLGWT